MGYSSNKFSDSKSQGFKGKAKWLLLAVWAIIILPFKAAAIIAKWVWTQAEIWWKGRKLKNLLFGLPALALIGGCTYLVISYQATSRFSRAETYLAAGQTALRQQNWEKANLFLGRAIELGINSNEVKYTLALAAEKTNDNARKLAILDELAPDDRGVYAPAHLYRATSLVTKPRKTELDMQTAEKQIHFALDVQPNNVIAHALLGDMYFQKGVLDPAILHLSQTDERSAKYRLLLAKAYDAKGDTVKARRHASEAAVVAEKESTANPSVPIHRLNHAEATLILKQFERTAEILREGLLMGENPAFRDALTMTFIRWSDDLLEASPDNRRVAFELIAAGLENTPNEILLFDRLIKLLKSESEIAEEVRKFLEQNISSGKAVAISHLVLGTALYEIGDRTGADFHMSRAFKMSPSSPIIANNFAWHLIAQDPATPEQALEIIDAVIRDNPQTAEYHDTKGHILCKLERWKDAISELEPTLKELPGRPLTHRALENAYKQLGLESLAEEHRSIAATLEDDAAK